MGASPFITTAHGKTVQRAFNDAVESASFKEGHGGYTGSIAEKNSFVRIPLPKGVKPYEEANRLIEEDDKRISDKWGPAGVFELGKDRWLFFGWASS
ncbi:hypothetical protein P0Y35_14310 [Kiritimatiellaeota bacterium B1221]|nr:hypothetical protein [Kiritimatiellaeota bacterium B1221]